MADSVWLGQGAGRLRVPVEARIGYA